jgi:hypothetical protein
LANEGVDAEGRNDFKAAVDLFARAIESGSLDSTERVMALVELAKSQANLGELTSAKGELQAALAADPENSEIPPILAEVETKLQEQIREEGRRAALATPPPDAPWGVLSELPGRCYWYDAPGQDTHIAYLRAVWLTQQKKILVEVRTKTDQPLVEEFTRSENGKFIYSGFERQAEVYGTIQVGVALAVEREWMNGKAFRTYFEKAGASGYRIRTQSLDGTKWLDVAEVNLIPVSASDLVTAQLIRPKKTCP